MIWNERVGRYYLRVFLSYMCVWARHTQRLLPVSPAFDENDFYPKPLVITCIPIGLDDMTIMVFQGPDGNGSLPLSEVCLTSC
jgi:hypothetical protein